MIQLLPEERRRARYLAGVCERCPAPHRPERTLCQACADRIRARNRGLIPHQPRHAHVRPLSRAIRAGLAAGLSVDQIAQQTGATPTQVRRQARP